MKSLWLYSHMKVSIADLKESNSFLNSLYENVTSAIFLADENARIYNFNDTFKTLFYKPDDEILKELCGNVMGCIFHVEEGMDCGDTSHCDECVLRRSIIMSFIEKVPVYKEMMIRDFYIKNKRITKYFIFTTKYITHDGDPMILVIFDDVTELEENKRKLEHYSRNLENLIKRKMNELFTIENRLKELQDQKEALIKEVHHRVGNNLQIISSLINIQCMERDEICFDDVKETSNRILVMRALYDSALSKLTDDRMDLSLYFKELTRYIMSQNPRHDVEIKQEMDPVTCSIDTAMPFGLLFYEVLSNSLRHAFPGSFNGEKRVTISLSHGENCSLSISDTGIGLGNFDTKMKSRYSVGLNLISLLADQLRGRIECRGYEGTEIHITVPADSISDR